MAPCQIHTMQKFGRRAEMNFIFQFILQVGFKTSFNTCGTGSLFEGYVETWMSKIIARRSMFMLHI